MQLGADTHFDHGWNTNLLAAAARAGITDIRDELAWAKVEKTQGVYSLTSGEQAYMNTAAQNGVSPLITLDFGNALYDGGKTPYTEAGREAFAHYAVEAIRQSHGQIKAVEVLNEVNGGTFVNGEFTNDRIGYYTALLKTVYTAIKAAFPDVEVIGASTINVPLPYLDKLFAAGALNYMDAVSVHPYSAAVDGMDDKIEQLERLMAKYNGADKSVVVTEFGYTGKDVSQEPGYLVKATTMLAAAHVEKAYWYDLAGVNAEDKSTLFDAKGNPLPALDAFKLMNDTLLKTGDPTRVNLSDTHAHIYEYPDGSYVVWGSGEKVTLAGDYSILDARGQTVAALSQLSDAPYVIRGSHFTLSVGASPVETDSRADYGTSDWSYFAKTASGKLIPLVQQTNDYGAFYGSPSASYLQVQSGVAHPGSTAVALERHTFKDAETVSLSGSWTIDAKSTGADVSILLNGANVWSQTVTGAAPLTLNGLTLTVKAGDTLDLTYGMHGSLDYDATAGHLTITKLAVPQAAAWTSSALESAVPLAMSAAPQALSAAVEAAPVVPGILVNGSDKADHLAGQDGSDTVNGGGGNDVLDGGHGDDSLVGGAGADTYVVDSVGDTVVEAPDGGVDTIQTSVSYALPDNVEKLVFTGSGDFVGVGNSADNSIWGGDGNDTLDGGAGADKLYGGAGDDSYVVDDPSDSVVEQAGAGFDTEYTTLDKETVPINVEQLVYIGTGSFTGLGGAGDDIIISGGGDDKLSGGSGNDTLLSGSGADTLIGGTGADSLVGGAGDDTYYVDDSRDQVVEAAGDGTDTVHASVDWVMTPGSEVEVATLTGSADLSLTGDELGQELDGNAGANVLQGLGGDDVLRGMGGDDTLYGGEGQDTLYAAGGADLMAGGRGDDVYYVASTSDRVQEAVGEGYDTVYAAKSFAVDPGQEIEKLVLTGSSGLSATGDAYTQEIDGNSGANTLSDGGDSHASTVMKGGAGADTYLISSALDTVVEDAAAGTDTIKTTLGSYSLASVANVENLSFVGTGAFSGVGNDLANTLTGGDGADTLDGGAGADKLIGGAGDDTYFVDNSADKVIEDAGAGHDTVVTTLSSYTLAANTEALVFAGVGSFRGTGNELDNLIYGGSAADKLSGGDGSDTLHGGGGADTLTGGAGSDTFAFDTSGEANGALISDFATGDRIDLHGIDAILGGTDDAFHLIGTAAFSHAAGELRVIYDAAHHVDHVSGDVNGDGAADFSFDVTASRVLDQWDFLL